MASNLEKIGGRTFSFGIMPATEALSVQVAVGRVIGEPLFKALTEADGGKDKAKLLELGAAAVGMMAARMDAADLLKTMQTVFTYVTVDGKRINMDSDADHGGFTGRPKEMWQVFIKALQVNFADFFAELHFDLPRAAVSKSSQ
jgi:hypothetical protein